MKKIRIILILVLIILAMPVTVYAVPGCCSHHGGEAGCSGGKTVCSDGWTSPCACDGTSRSSNYGTGTNNNNKNSNSKVGITGAIIGGILGFGGLILLGVFIDWAGDKRKKARNEKYRLEQKAEQKRIETDKETIIKHIIDNKFNVSNELENIDSRTLDNFKSDDLIQILESESENIFTLFDSIRNNEYGYTKERIFDEFTKEVLESNKLNKFQIKCLKYIIKNRYIKNDKYTNEYPNIFLLALTNKHVEIIEYIINNCEDIKFSFYGAEAKQVFTYLLNIDDIELVKKISQTENFNVYVESSMLLEAESSNIKNKYRIMSALSNEPLDIESLINNSINFNDDKKIMTDIEALSKMDDFIEENGYYIIFELIKKLNVECIIDILNKYKNIDLNKRINSMDKKYDGLTPLTYACYRKSLKVVELLVEYGVDCNFLDKYGNSALAYACAAKSLKIVNILYEKGCRLENDYYNKSIEEAIKTKNISHLLPVYITKLKI